MKRPSFPVWLAIAWVGASGCPGPADPPDGGPSDIDATAPPDAPIAPDASPADAPLPADAPPPADAPAADAGVCSVPADCQDGIFCNGYEGCAPGAPGADARGCLGGTPPCMGGATCEEAIMRCVFCATCSASTDCGDGLAC